MVFSVRKAGLWAAVTAWSLRQGGTWKTVQKGHVRQGGVWKQFYSTSAPPPPPPPPPPPSISVSLADEVAIYYQGTAPTYSNSFSLGPSVSGGTPPYSYSWSGGGAFITGFTPYSGGAGCTFRYTCGPYGPGTGSLVGNFSVTVTDALGNTGSDSGIVYQTG